MLALGVGNAWGAEKTITLTYSDFGLTNSYAEKTATVDGIGFTVNQGYKGSGNVIQMNNSKGAGVLYNTTSIAGLKSIKVNVSSGSKTYTITSGTAQTPSGNSQTGTATKTFSIPSGDTYFQLKVSGASYFSSIVITYDDSNSGGETPGTGGGEDPETPGPGGSGTIVIKYNSTFMPSLPTTSGSVNTTATAHTAEGLSFKEKGIYKGSSNNYLMFVQNKGFIYNTQSLGTITSVSVTYTSQTSTSGQAGVYFGTTEQSTYTTTSNNTIKGQNQTETWTNTIEGNGFFQLSTSNKNVQITQIAITYTSGSEGGGSEETAASPTLPATQNFVNSLEVTMTAADGANIYYTNDGSEPTTSSTPYSTPFTITETTTIKAIAVEDGKENSAVVTATYTKVEALTTIEAIFEDATANSSEHSKFITFDNWVVTGVKNDNVYVTNGTEGFIIYQSGHGFVVGDKLSGTVECKVLLYNGSAELKGVTASKLTVTKEGEAQVNVLDEGGIAALTGLNTGSIIKISGECTNSGSNYYINGVQLYNQLFTFTNPTPGTKYDCTGVYCQYNKVKEILPRSAEDLTIQAGKSSADTYWNGTTSATLTVRVGDEITEMWSTSSTGTKSFSSSETSVATVDNDGNITIVGAGTTTITYTTAENQDYYSGTATLTLTVKEALPGGATEFTWVAVDMGVANATDVTTATKDDDPISIVFAQNDGANHPKYYTSGESVRMYPKNNMTITSKTEGKLLSRIEIVWGTNETAKKKLEGDGLTENIWEGLLNEVVFVVPEGSGNQAHIQALNIIYADGVETTLSIEDVAMKTTDEPKAIVVTTNVTPTPEITYIVDNTSVATITDGKVTAVGVGTTNVTATIAKGTNYTAATTTFSIIVSEKTLPTLSFPNATENANIDDVFTAPILNNPQNVTVEYSSNNTTVAEVDATTGAVTIKNEGTAVITASFAGNDEYAANSTSYTLVVANPYKDVLTASGIGQSSYGDWEKTFTTATIYKGNSTTGTGEQTGTIQMRDNNKSGIVTTSSIGYLKSLSAAGTKNKAKILSIYAKNTAYESPADLHNSEKKGTLIGTIAAGGGELVFKEGKSYADNYKYIGIRTDDGAVYYDDITIVWTPATFATYTVTYAAGEGTGEDIVINNLEDGTTIQLAENTFTYTGYAFAGWSDGTNTYQAGENYAVTGDVTFTAQWAKLYTVTYQAGEATGEDIVRTVPEGNYTLESNLFTFSGHTFDGWLNNETKYAGGASFEVTDNVTFVAQWVENAAEPVSVTFLAGTDTGDKTISKEGITVSITDGTLAEEEYRCYSGKKMIVSSEVGNITKIVIECTKPAGEEKYGPDHFSATGYTYSDKTGTWSGNAESVTFSASAQVRMESITVTYIPNGNTPKQPAGLEYNPTSYTITVGDEFTTPTLINPNELEVTYASDNTTIATIDATTGIVTLVEGATGTVTITATTSGNENYSSGSASYSIIITEKADDLSGEWQLVTDASKLQAGMEVIVAQYVDEDGTIYTMGGQKTNNRDVVESSVLGETLTPTTGTAVLTLVDAGNGTFALQASNGNYLYAASSTSNHLKETATINDNAKWSVSVTEGKASVVAQGSNSRNTIRFNKSNTPKIFSCYESGQQDIALYAKKPAESRTTSAGRYGTVCLPGNIVKCLGATLYEVAGKDDNKVIFDEVLTPEAGMPYIFLAHNAEVLFYCGDQTAAAGNHNSLHGTFTVMQDAQLDGMYMVQNNKIVKCAATGCGVAAYRAYFNGTELEALGSAPAPMPGRRRITMGTESENTTTGTEDVVAPEGQTLKLIENGQLIIIRNGEKFNAQGIKL